MTRRWLAPLLLVLAVNAVVLGGAAHNRAGEPEATVVLTERELQLDLGSPRDEESAVSVRLLTQDWRPPPGDDEDAEVPTSIVVDQAKLAALGFEVEFPLNREWARAEAGRQLARPAFVVLEQAGPSWQRWRDAAARYAADESWRTLKDADERDAEQERRQDAKDALERGSRLFLVDVGPDPAELRRLHPDRHATFILPAKVRPWAYEGPGPVALHGSIELLIPALDVPRALAKALPEASPRASVRGGPIWSEAAEALAQEPRFEVTLAVGRRHEPWVESVRPLAGP